MTWHSRQTLATLTGLLRQDGNRTKPAADTDWIAVLALANAHFLGPALAAVLAAMPDWDMLPADLRAYLKHLYRGNLRRNLHLRRQAGEIVAAFGRAGLPLMLLKGGAGLLAGDIRSSAIRMIFDLDLLVPRPALPQAAALLEDIGYRAVRRYPAGHNAYGDFVRAGAAGAIDLHGDVIDAPWLMPSAEVWRDAHRIDLPEGNVLVPSPADRILHNLLHGQVHHIGRYYRGSADLRQVYDFSVLARQQAGRVDWPALASRLDGWRLGGVLQFWLLAAHRLFGLDWPLALPPGRMAEWQLHRCLLQVRMPILERLTLPLANLCGGFAAHRMVGLYGADRPLALHRLHHAWQFLDKSSGRLLIARLFKAE